MSKDYPGRPTRPIPREELAPIGAAPNVEPPPDTRRVLVDSEDLALSAEDEVTKTMCPACQGSRSTACTSCGGLGIVEPVRAVAIEHQVPCPLCCAGKVAPEIALAFEGLIAKAKDQT